MKYRTIILIAGIGIICLYRAISPLTSIDIPRDHPLPTSYSINTYQTYPRQSKNSCGPYSLAFALHTQGATEAIADPAYISHHIYGRRNTTSLTLPSGIEWYLLTYPAMVVSYPTIIPYRIYSDTITDGIYNLQYVLSTKHAPIILLGSCQGYQHYEVLVGYDTTLDAYYLYNPILKTDTNGPLPGNETLSSSAFIAFWSGGGKYRLYTLYAIAVAG